MKYLRSPIPYMGNKFKLLKQLIPLFPKECNTFVDLFGGSGVVCMNYKGEERTIYNDFNHNIVEMIKMIVNNEPKELNDYWQNKVNCYKLPKQSTKRTDFADKDFFNERQRCFNKMRNDYNLSNPKDYKDLFLLSCYSINHLIRFNQKDEFNVSSGNDSYSEKNYMCVCNMHNSFKGVEIHCENSLTMDLSFLTIDDFVYMDCPYLNTEAVYNEKGLLVVGLLKAITSCLKLLNSLTKEVSSGDCQMFLVTGAIQTST